MNCVVAYFDDLGFTEERDILAEWLRSWEKAEWQTIILNRGDAECHPQAEAFRRHVAQLPSVNNRDYENACYCRWLAADAFAQSLGQPFLFTDYDIINFGFRPEELPLASWPLIGYAATSGPTPMLITPQGSALLVDAILQHQGVAVELPTGPHCSDMHILNEVLMRQRWHIPLCMDYGEALGKFYQLIHFNGTRCKGRKVACVRAEEKLRGILP